MDAKHFDRLTRQVGAAVTRRSVIAALAAAAGLVAGRGGFAGDAEARPAICRASGRYCTRSSQCCNRNCLLGKRVPRGVRNTCACLAPDLRCNGVCRQVQSDSLNCGACGNVCYDGATCELGECVAPPAAPCSSLDPDTYICAATADGDEVSGFCGLIETRLSAQDAYAPIPCSSDSDCADAFGPCAKPGVTCFCGVGVAIGDVVPYTDAIDQFGEPAVCGAIADDQTMCTVYQGLPVIMCSEQGGQCATDSDCCNGQHSCNGNACGNT